MHGVRLCEHWVEKQPVLTFLTTNSCQDEDENYDDDDDENYDNGDENYENYIVDDDYEDDDDGQLTSAVAVPFSHL